jgi:hypothetical protein
LLVSQADDGAASVRWVTSEGEPAAVHDLRKLSPYERDPRIRTIEIRADGDVAWGVVDEIANRLRGLADDEVYVFAENLPEVEPFAYHACTPYIPPPPILQRRKVVRRPSDDFGAPAVQRDPEPIRFESCFTKYPKTGPAEDR